MDARRKPGAVVANDKKQARKEPHLQPVFSRDQQAVLRQLGLKMEQVRELQLKLPDVKALMASLPRVSALRKCLDTTDEQLVLVGKLLRKLQEGNTEESKYLLKEMQAFGLSPFVLEACNAIRSLKLRLNQFWIRLGILRRDRYALSSMSAISCIDEALRSGFIKHYEVRSRLPTYRFYPSRSEPFRSVVRVCYEAIGAAEKDPDRIIRAWLRSDVRSMHQASYGAGRGRSDDAGERQLGLISKPRRRNRGRPRKDYDAEGY